MILPVTFTFAALSGVAMFIFVAWIGLTRAPLGVLRGDGGHPVLFKCIRIHGNFTETAPIAIATMAAAEAAGLAPLWLWLGLVSYGLGRALHYMLYDSKSRGIPMTLSVGPAALMGLWVLYRLWLV